MPKIFEYPGIVIMFYSNESVGVDMTECGDKMPAFAGMTVWGA
jgi:hypothetical protein